VKRSLSRQFVHSKYSFVHIHIACSFPRVANPFLMNYHKYKKKTFPFYFNYYYWEHNHEALTEDFAFQCRPFGGLVYNFKWLNGTPSCLCPLSPRGLIRQNYLPPQGHSLPEPSRGLEDSTSRTNESAWPLRTLYRLRRRP